jgi:branched-chain amino acid transport system ATP-binding protein
VSLLRVERLSRSFGGVRAVDDVSFSITKGIVHAIIGPNGAGKTTLFNLITGVLRPSSGRILFEEREITGAPPERLARLGIARTFQNLQIFFNMTVRENVLVGRHLHLKRGFLSCLFHTPALRQSERQARETVDQLLERLGLARWADARADSLPYGALRRLEIARALASEPKLLLLDEPAAGCNESETRDLEGMLRQIAADGPTIVLVEHDMRLVMNFAERILVLDHGRRLAEGTAAEIRQDPRVIEAYLGRQAVADVARG